MTAAMAPKEATVTLSIAGKRAEGKGATPIDAIVAASSALAKELAPPPMSEAAVRSWGAADEAGARRIERVWRRLVLNVLPNDEAVVKALVASDPGSAWSHMLFVFVRPRGTPESRAEIARAMALAGELPPARAELVRGTLLVIDPERSEQQRTESLSLLRHAYNEAPDDPDVAGLYTAIAVATGSEEEGFAVLDRLCARFPTRSVLAVANALGNAREHDLARDERYLASLRALLPESFAWEMSVRNLVSASRLDEARAALDFGRRLGMSGSSADAASIDALAAMVDLAALSPASAREHARPSLADPRITQSSYGAVLVAASYDMEGRVTDGEAAELHEMERQRAVGSPIATAALAIGITSRRRWLGMPPPDAVVLAAFAPFTEDKGQEPELLSSAITEAALVRARTDPKAARATLSAALDKIRGCAEKERDPVARGVLLLTAIPLVRAVSGDAAAAKIWLDSDRAPFALRRGVALDAALALEASGKRDEAAKAYTLAMDPSLIEGHALDAMIARVRLAELYRASGRAADAAALEAVVDRLWAKADPGLRETVKKMK